MTHQSGWGALADDVLMAESNLVARLSSFFHTYLLWWLLTAYVPARFRVVGCISTGNAAHHLLQFGAARGGWYRPIFQVPEGGLDSSMQQTRSV